MSSGTLMSVLADDVISVEGSFLAKSVVAIEDEEGVEFARGLVQLSAATLADASRSAEELVKPYDYVILEAL
ncbi:MAG: PUA domain-containing protein [Promethearchaeia archaeon]